MSNSFNSQENDENDDEESEDGDSNDPDENAVENDKNVEINDHKEHDMTTGEESDDEAEEDYSSNRDEGGNDTGGNSEEVVIISFPTSRKRAYSVCLYISSPTATPSNNNMISHSNTWRKSRIPRLIQSNRIRNVRPASLVLSHHPYSIIKHFPPISNNNMKHFQPSRIPRPIAPTNFLRHAK